MNKRAIKTEKTKVIRDRLRDNINRQKTAPTNDKMTKKRAEVAINGRKPPKTGKTHEKHPKQAKTVLTIGYGGGRKRATKKAPTFHKTWKKVWKSI